MNVVNKLKELVYSLTCERGYKEKRCICHIRQCIVNLLGKAISCTVILFNKVPLIYANNCGLSSLMCYTCDLFILLSNTLRSINDKKTHISSLNCHFSSENTVFFNSVTFFPHLANKLKKSATPTNASRP